MNLKKKHFYKITVIICFCVLVCPVSGHAESVLSPPTAIVGSSDEEVQLIKDHIKDRREAVFLGIRFFSGKVGKRSVVLAQTGVGKVNAAMSTTLLLDHYKPREVIFTGIAGGLNPDLLPGDVVIALKTAQHDLGAFTIKGFFPSAVRNPVNNKRNPVFFPSDSNLVRLTQQAAKSVDFTPLNTSKGERKPNIVTGVIITGDAFIASETKKNELRKLFSADAVEMEGGAVAQVCYQQDVPFIILRSLSDTADQNAYMDMTKFYKAAARNSAELVFKLVELLSKAEEKGPK
jgi:adenosylhomocysteine nucleosidase